MILEIFQIVFQQFYNLRIKTLFFHCLQNCLCFFVYLQLCKQNLILNQIANDTLQKMSIKEAKEKELRLLNHRIQLILFEWNIFHLISSRMKQSLYQARKFCNTYLLLVDFESQYQYSKKSYQNYFWIF